MGHFACETFGSLETGSAASSGDFEAAAPFRKVGVAERLSTHKLARRSVIDLIQDRSIENAADGLVDDR
jgi:hypothetical protein